MIRWRTWALRPGALLVSLLLIGQAAAGPTVGQLAGRPATVMGASTARVGPFTFALGPYELRALPMERLPYYGPTLVPSCGLTDASGVAIYKAADGNYYNHPGAQAQCAINMIRNYRLSRDAAHLGQAMANAQRLLELSTTFRGASFFPYPFSYNNPHRSLMVAPWYSAMAQGQALSAFVRLYAWTGDAKWRAAADGAFASFKVAPSAGSPWVAAVDNGLLWLDEYPTMPLDRVFNGHNFAMYGLYDYWWGFASPEARTLALGAIHSSWQMVPRLRVPGGISQYCVSQACLDHGIRNPAYHGTHLGQMQTLFAMTGHWHFASTAEALTADHPLPGSGRAILASGTHDGYAFDDAGRGSLVRRVTLSAATTLSFSQRRVPGGLTNPGNGIWLLMSEGPLAGLWVRESDRVRPRGLVDRLDFWGGRNVDVEAGTYVGTTYTVAGDVTGTYEATTAATSWTYGYYARVNGHPSVLLASGPLAGTWLTLGTRTLRDTTLFADVDRSFFRADIIWLTTRDITRGCHTFRYCPGAAVTREQMASFISRALALPATTVDAFTDDTGRVHEDDINRLAAAGITNGCGGGRFCPTRAVNREEMASLIARALALPATTDDYFSDDTGSPHEPDINRLAAAGITTGCSEGLFCPIDPVTRGQMAALLHRALTP